MNNKPLVSVLMTVYNRAKYISDAIESILNSTFKNFELIIVDDYSTDNSINIAKQFQAKDNRISVYQNEKNLGDYPNRNKAASYANGKYIKFLDADDIMYPHCLEIMVDSMEKYPSALMGISQGTSNSEVPYPFITNPHETYSIQYFKRNILFYGPINSIYKRNLFLSENGFIEIRHDGDSLTNLKHSAKYPIVHITPGLVWWRVHPEQENKKRPKNNMHYQLLLKALDEPECPFSIEEKKNAKKLIGNTLLKIKFLDTLKKFSNILYF